MFKAISNSFFNNLQKINVWATCAPPSHLSLTLVHRDAVTFTQGCSDVILIIMSLNPA